MKLALIGATGLVGSKMLQVLAERNFPVTELLPVASERSIGKTLEWKGKSWKIMSIEEAVAQKPSIALYSAGGEISLKTAPLFAAVGTTVIDNSSAWRMSAIHKLIVPEINASILTSDDKIIANPNCSTIQMVQVLQPLHELYKIKRVVVSTYQSITGTGANAVTQMNNERNNIQGEMAYKYQIDQNLIPQIDLFLNNGYTKEEMKMVQETCKIMGDDSIKVTATAVRVPVVGGHSESVNIEFENEVDMNEVLSALKKTKGLIVQDDVDNQIYPMPILAQDKDDTFVGRIRRDYTQANTINLWIVSDNLRKGAATNAIQIAEYLLAHHLIS